MQIPKRKLAGIACNIREQLQTFRSSSIRQVIPACGTFIENVEQLKSVQRKLEICEIRSWDAAASRIFRQIESNLQALLYHKLEIERAIQACKRVVPTQKEVFQELVQADEEFGNIQFNSEGLLSVCTEPIRLGEVFLGDFEIQLHVPSLARIGDNTVYSIVAQDPHPAATNESVTHPHVNDERLCAGEASTAINSALASGRVCDFFLIVRSVLMNYNPGSTYVSLEEWEGTPCFDCGYVMSEGNCCWCTCCENDFCEECSSLCRVCSEPTCNNCLEDCPVCEALTCSVCLTSCPGCGEPLCRDCLKDSRCTCTEEDEEEKDEKDKEEVVPFPQECPAAKAV